MKQKNDSYTSQKLALIAIVFWSTVATAFKLALQGLSVFDLLFISTTVSFITLSIFVFSSRKLRIGLKKINHKTCLKSFLLSLLNPLIYYYFLFKAYDYLPAQEALALNYAWPIVLVLFSCLFLKEPFRLKNLFVLLIGFIGVLVIVFKGDFSQLNFHHLGGKFFALASTFVWAFYWVFNKKDSIDPILRLFLNFMFSFILIFFLKLAFFQGFHYPALSLFSGIYIGLFEMGITFILWLNALKISSNTTKLSLLIFISPALSLIFIHFILKEPLFLTTFIGLGLIIFAIVIDKVIPVNLKPQA